MDCLPGRIASQQLADVDHVGAPLRALPKPNKAPPETLVRDRNAAASLASVVAKEVIPRLVRAHGVDAGQRQPARTRLSIAPEARPTPAEVDAFVATMLERPLREAFDSVEMLRAKGLSLEILCLDLLAPTARRLGDLWRSDACSFAQVTVAMLGLQQLLREIAPSFPRETRVEPQALRALFVPVGGEQHTMGLQMLIELFSRAGWSVSGAPPASRLELARSVAREWFDVVGLSASCDARLEVMKRDVHAVRQASLNPQVGIMVGGPKFVACPELAAALGADLTAPDARQAVVRAELLVTERRGLGRRPCARGVRGAKA